MPIDALDREPTDCVIPNSSMPNVNPNIMRWARETAGLSAGEAARKLALVPARGQTPIERLLALEAGTTVPTRPMLSKMSAVYRRPLLAFYLAEPPIVIDRGEDFRTLPEEPDPADEAVLDALVRNVRCRQAMVKSVLEDEEEPQWLPFIGSKTVEDGVKSVRTSIADVIDVDVLAYRQSDDPASGFRMLREAAEEAGIFVLLAGDLGTHHTALDTGTFRGFALSDPAAPFVVLNPQDAKAALSFTLLHELAHLWLGVTGVSGSDEPRLALERFCNDVASTFFLPEAELRLLGDHARLDFEDLAEKVSAFATQRKISGSMVAYRLYRSGRISRQMWRRLGNLYRELWFQNRQAGRVRERGRRGGPGYYVLRRNRAGRALVELVRRNLRHGGLTTTEAGTVLGVRPKSVAGVIAR